MTEISRWHPDFRSATFWSQAASVFAILVGSLVLVGWIFDISALKSVLPGLATMKVNTAIAFVLAGIALGLWNKPHLEKRERVVAQITSVLVFLLGSLTLSEYLFGWDLGIDRLFLRSSDLNAGAVFPGRMAQVTAFGLGFLGLALWFLGRPIRELGSQVLSIIVTARILLVLAG